MDIFFQFSEIQVMLCCTCLIYAVELWFSYSIKLLGSDSTLIRFVSSVISWHVFR